MFARHVDTVFIIIVANNASIRMSFLTNISGFYCTNVSLAWSNLENCFVTNFKQRTDLSFIWKPSPCSVCRTHIFNVKLLSNWCDCRMNIRQVLVLRKVQQVCLFSTNCRFLMIWNLDTVPQRRSLNYFQCNHLIFQSSLELVTAHLDNHVLN